MSVTKSRTLIGITLLNWLCQALVLGFLLAGSPARAAEKDDAYLEVFNLIQQGDSLFTSGNMTNALSKYQRAEIALQNFRTAYPDWNVKTVAFRLSYLADKIAACSAKLTSAETSEAGPGVKAPAPAGSSAIKLLDAGAEPRKVLRLHPKEGDRQAVDMTLKMGMELQLGDTQNQAVKLPAMKMPMEVTIKSVSPDGDITYEAVMGEPSIADEGAGASPLTDIIKTSMAGVKGLTGTGTVSSLGLVKAVNIKLPSGADPQTQQAMDQMKDSLAQMSAPFPEEAIGPGAKWEVSQPIKSLGMTLNQVTTYQLVAIDGERVTSKSTFTQNASNQKIQSPTMPGMKMDLTKMTGRGSGDVKLDLERLMPAQATVDSHAEIAVGMDAGGQKQTMKMTMDLKLRFEAH
ncbi:MAG TPA: DUF6263 family protein [Verrucomicrobiae bacterium]